MSANFSKILDAAPEWQEGFSETLREMVRRPELSSMLKEIMQEAESKGLQLLGINFLTEEGRAQAVALQAMSKGLLRALDILEERFNGDKQQP